MRAAGGFKEGRRLLQISFQPTADSLLAERLISSSLAGPSSVPSVTQVAQRVSNAQLSNTIAGLGRLYSSLTRVGASGSAAVGPKQQVGLDFSLRHPLHKLFCLVFHLLAIVCRPMQLFRDRCGDISALNHHAKVRFPVLCQHMAEHPPHHLIHCVALQVLRSSTQRTSKGALRARVCCTVLSGNHAQLWLHSALCPAQQDVSKGGCSAGKTDKKGPEETPELKQLVDSLTKSSGNIIAGVGIIAIAMFMRNLTRPDTQEISFQHFKTQLLAKDVVDRIEVANKTTAKVQFCCNPEFLLQLT